ncbi:MAG: flagellar hook-associated protein FlgL [bacterium]
MLVSRVTQKMMTDTFIADIQRSLRSLNELQRQISTGKRVRFPSDDPIDADRILDYRQTVAQVQQYSRNVDDMDSLASNVDGVLDTITSLLFRARDLAVRASSDAPMAQRDRDAIAEELDQILHELVFQANQKFDGKFIFSGNKTENTPFSITNEIEFVVDGSSAIVNMPEYADKTGTRRMELINNSEVAVTAVYVNGVADPAPFFDVDNNTITLSAVPPAGSSVRVVFNRDVLVSYHGDTGTREVEISEGAKLGVMYPGASPNRDERTVFSGINGDPKGIAGVEVFQTLIDLRDNIFKYEDVSADAQLNIRTGISDIDEFLSKINDVRSDLGGRMNRLELAKNRLENININTQELLSNKENVDMAEAISEMVLQQNVYQSALGAGARIIQMSLLDFLR